MYEYCSMEGYMSPEAIQIIKNNKDHINSMRFKLSLGLIQYNIIDKGISKMNERGFIIEWDFRNCYTYVTWETYEGIINGKSNLENR